MPYQIGPRIVVDIIGKHAIFNVGFTCTTRGITPGSDLVPCIVCVFPDDVTPYAKMVTV